MGTGNDVLELNGGVVNTVLQDNETGSQGDDTALIQGGSILGKLDQAGGNDILSLTGGQVVDVDQGSGSDTATLSGGTATVQLAQEFLDIAPGDQVLALGQVVMTLTDLRGVGRVRFEIDGEAVATPLPDGTSTEDSVSREEFRSLATAG